MDGVVWSRLFTDRGVDVIPGNFIHGMINTKGCWMMFRNYNWPVSVREKLFQVYANIWRMNKPNSQSDAALARAGYDDFSEQSGMADSWDKFSACDMNFAYNFFMRDVVGVQFFSKDAEFFEFENMHNPHGLVFEKTFALSNVTPGPLLYHDLKARRTVDPTFTLSDSLWQNSLVGFRTASGFLPEATIGQNISGADLQQRTWSDWSFYKDESYSLPAAMCLPYTGGTVK